MSSVPIQDTELRFPDFTIVSASAGAGKTHTLTLRLLQLLLSDRIPKNRLNSILAMTFTRNASAEMRQRVLLYLKKGYLGEKDVLQQLSACLSGNEEDLRTKCGRMIDSILKDYSSFQVQTIDSFMSRVFRSSAFEFGFSPGFEIETDNRHLIEEAFDRFAQNLPEEPAKLQLFENLTDMLAELRQEYARYSWNPYKTLCEMVLELYGNLNAQDRKISPGPAEKIQLRKLEKDIRENIDSLASLASKPGLPVTKYFETLMQAAKDLSLDELIFKKTLYNPPFKTSKDREIKRLAEEWNGRLAPLQEKIRELVSQYIKNRAYNYYRPFVDAYNAIMQTIELTMRRNGRISLADISRKLIGYISEETVPQIYLYIGDSIYHYLIDEFQDTSPVQWAAVKPLLAEALSKQGSLFIVGDTKQSIYSFRYADWRIMKEIMETNIFPSAPVKLYELGINYRSHEAIVDFSKKVFHETVPQAIEGDSPRLSGLSTFMQEEKDEFRGRGYVEIASFSAERGLKPERDKILEIVSDCIKRGYGHRDIMIITPQNEHVIEVSGWLNSAKIRFISHSSLDIRLQSVAGEILALLRFLDSPLDDLSFATFLLGGIFSRILAVDNAGLSKNELCNFILQTCGSQGSPPLYSAFRKKFPSLWNMYFNEPFSLIGYLPMYDLVSEIYKIFRLFGSFPDDEAALAKLLDVIKNFEETGRNTLRDFLDYSAEEGSSDEWNVVVPPGEDAVSVMTIHKAKGLDSRIVIVLLVDSRPHTQNLFFKKGEEGIQLLRIKKDETDYSTELENIYTDQQIGLDVDELNKLYVALTRAREEMYIISIKKPFTDRPSKFLPQTGYEPAEKPEVEKKEELTIKPAGTYHSASRVPLPTASSDKLAVHERTRGELIHEILSGITYASGEFEQVLSGTIGKISLVHPEFADHEEVCKLLLDFLNLPGIRPYFDRTEGRTIYNEQEYVDKNGRLFRMDRVVEDAKRVTVIDFKTGEDNKEYDLQIKEYMSLLRDYYPGKQVAGLLAFIDLKKTRAVS